MKTIRICLLIGALGFAVFTAFDHNPESDMDTGWRAFRAGDMDSALRMARLAALLSGQDAKEWRASQELQARAALKLKRTEYAHGVLDRLLAVHPDHVGGLQLRGEIRLKAGDPKGALADLTRSQKSGAKGDAKPHKSQAPHLARLSQAFLATGDLKSAVRDLKLAYKLDPRHPQVLYTASLVLEKQGQILPALEFMERAIPAANRREQGFFLSPEGKKWTARLVLLRRKAKVPADRPYFKTQ